MSEQKSEPRDDEIIENEESSDEDDDLDPTLSAEEDEEETPELARDQDDAEPVDDLESDDDEDDDSFDTLPDEDEAFDEESDLTNPYDDSDVMDVDAALAAVSQLTLLTQETSDELDDEEAIEDADYQSLDEEFEPQPFIRPEYDNEFEQPRDISMSRGQLASVIPALTLIILGGWLTFTLTTTNTPPSTELLFALGLVCVGVIFLSQWLTSARMVTREFLVRYGNLIDRWDTTLFFASSIGDNRKWLVIMDRGDWHCFIWGGICCASPFIPIEHYGCAHDSGWGD